MYKVIRCLTVAFLAIVICNAQSTSAEDLSIAANGFVYICQIFSAPF